MDFLSDLLRNLLFGHRSLLWLLISALLGVTFTKLDLGNRYARRAGDARPSRFPLWCGGIALLLTGWLVYGILRRQDTVIVGAVLLLLPVLFALGWKNVGIVYDDHGFTKRNFLGLRRRYAYEQITALRCPPKGRTLRLHAEGTQIPVDKYMVGLPAFLNLMGEAYSAAHDGEPLPGLSETVLPGRHTKKQ